MHRAAGEVSDSFCDVSTGNISLNHPNPRKENPPKKIEPCNIFFFLLLFSFMYCSDSQILLVLFYNTFCYLIDNYGRKDV